MSIRSKRLGFATAALALTLGAFTTPRLASAEPVTLSGVVTAAAAATATQAAADTVKRNQAIADRESTAAGRALALPTGISADAIRKHGPAGGPNSFLRKPFG